MAMWLYLSGQSGFAGRLPDGTTRVVTRRIVGGQLAYIVAVAVAFVSAAVSLVICALIAAYYVRPGRLGGSHP
jgi:hypothetical protein